MTLNDAINVLRVRGIVPWFRDPSHHLKAVEVGSPHATVELTIKTEMPKGVTIPKGRISLPREPKEKEKDRILVFAEGRQAEDAKKAGADIVGGPELVEGVRWPIRSILSCNVSVSCFLAPIDP